MGLSRLTISYIQNTPEQDLQVAVHTLPQGYIGVVHTLDKQRRPRTLFSTPMVKTEEEAREMVSETINTCKKLPNPLSEEFDSHMEAENDQNAL